MDDNNRTFDDEQEQETLTGVHIAAADEQEQPRPAEPLNYNPEIYQACLTLIREGTTLLVPGWEIQDSECDALAMIYAKVINKYWPNLDIGVDLAAIVLTIAIFSPRIHLPRKPEPASDDNAT